MLGTYERKLVLTYLVNACSRLPGGNASKKTLVEWTRENWDFLFPGKKNDPDAQETAVKGTRCTKRKPRNWSELSLRLKSESSALKRVRPDALARHIGRLGNMLELSQLDERILEFYLRYHSQPLIESLVDDGFSRGWARFNEVRGQVAPSLLGISIQRFLTRCASGAPLIRSGLLTIDSRSSVSVLKRLHRLWLAPERGTIDVQGLLLGKPLNSELVWSDFDHIAAARDHTAKLLQGALSSGAKGVNVLVYGPPGTGKTEFCKAVAEEVGAAIFGVGEADDDGEDPGRRHRLSELHLAHRLLAQEPNSLLLFDEMDDLLSSDGVSHFEMGATARLVHGGGSKVYMNRLLETVPVPILWTTNHQDMIDPAILRRMVYAVEMRMPPVRVRTQVWSRQLERHGITATPEEVRSLAEEFTASPGVAAGATAGAHLGAGDITDVRRGVASLAKLLGDKQQRSSSTGKFVPELVQAGSDMATLTERIVGTGQSRFSLCLSGPPGTGKSAYVRFLADRLGMEVLQKRTSDLLSPWVGMAEKHIAEAFEEARDESAFLVFDEADALLGDRRHAVRSWEITQVNEMLTWMESHPLPFACTTNLIEHLDPACMRRFLFKLKLDYLAPYQVGLAFQRFFDMAPPSEVTNISGLTPGDFDVVRRKAEILGVLEDAETLISFLQDEAEAKPDKPSAFGFRPRVASVPT